MTDMSNPEPAPTWPRLPGLLCAAALTATMTSIPSTAPAAPEPPASATPATPATPAAPAAGGQLPGPDQLPSNPDLPDPFLMKDGSRVKTPQDWRRRRGELIELILGYEYGRPAPAPATGSVKAEEQSSKKVEGTDATEKTYLLTMGPEGKVSTHLVLTVPPGDGPFPVIVKGDLTWGRVRPEIVADVIKHGYLLAEFDRTEIAPDKNGAPGGVRPLYPDADWGTLAAWAWGFQRTVDYLLTRPDVDAKRVVVTGHSRGGKAALLAGALDERVALTVPNGSGCGGAGCYRVNPPKTEDIAAITSHFPYWFGPRFPEFVGKVDKLPFDQHEVRALVAPRALLTTDALGDVWANPIGTEETYLASREVFRFLGAGDKIGIHYREGKHEQNEEDWAALLAFADQLFAGKKAAESFDKLPLPDVPKAFGWSAPKGE